MCGDLISNHTHSCHVMLLFVHASGCSMHHTLSWSMYICSCMSNDVIICCIEHYSQHAASYSEHLCNYCVSSLIYMRCMCYIRNRSLWMQYVNILPVLKHGLRSLMCVRVRDCDNSLHNKCNHVLLTYVAGKSAWTSLSTSMRIRTRKMVNYANEGWSLRKLRWKPIAILTCKSFVKQWYRGERLIEPSSSWFPPKFPSG